VIDFTEEIKTKIPSSVSHSDWTGSTIFANFVTRGGPAVINNCDMNTWRGGVANCFTRLEADNAASGYSVGIVWATIDYTCGDYREVRCSWDARGDPDSLETVADIMKNTFAGADYPYMTMRSAYLDMDPPPEAAYSTVSWITYDSEVECVTIGYPNFSAAVAGQINVSTFAGSGSFIYSTMPFQGKLAYGGQEKCEDNKSHQWQVYNIGSS